MHLTMFRSHRDDRCGNVVYHLVSTVVQMDLKTNTDLNKRNLCICTRSSTSSLPKIKAYCMSSWPDLSTIIQVHIPTQSEDICFVFTLDQLIHYGATKKGRLTRPYKTLQNQEGQLYYLVVVDISNSEDPIQRLDGDISLALLCCTPYSIRNSQTSK
jgi:hypothetical protein